MPTRLLLILFIGALNIPADSKTEAELRRQLAASEAARVADAKKLAAQLSELTAQSKAANKASTQTQQNASSTADANAEAARAIAEVNGQIASLAAARAMEAANKASDQAMQAQLDANRLRFGLYSLIVVTIGGIVTTGLGRYQSHGEHLKTLAETAKIKDTITTLEKNTNSIKDALVATTAQESFARGLKQGTESVPTRHP